MADRIEHAAVVDQAVVARRDHIDAGVIQLARVGFALVTQDIHLGGLNERGGQALEAFIGRLQGRGIDILPLYYTWLKDFMEAGKARMRGDTLQDTTTVEVRDLRQENERLTQLVATRSVFVSAVMTPFFR